MATHTVAGALRWLVLGMGGIEGGVGAAGKMVLPWVRYAVAILRLFDKMLGARTERLV